MLIHIIITLFIVGVVLWAINRFGAGFCDPNILKLINVAVILIAVLWLLQVLGFMGSLDTMHVR